VNTERIDVLFGKETIGTTVLDRDPDPPRRGGGKAYTMQPLPNYLGLLLVLSRHEVHVKVTAVTTDDNA